MATARQSINKANSWIGIKEGPEADKIIIDPWNKATGCKPPAKSKKNPWCAIAEASLLIQIKAAGYSKAATCKSQRAYYKRNKRWIEKGKRPSAGDVIFIKGHEGHVTSTSYTGKATYTSGNSKNAYRKSSFNWKTAKTAGGAAVLGYGRPIYK